jgi:hypothetical protein
VAARSTAACARAIRPASSALEIGCWITAKRWSGTPCARAMTSAASTKAVVITETAGTPRRSAVTASCKLHDEQLPQSPTPLSTASQPSASAISSSSAGAL